MHIQFFHKPPSGVGSVMRGFHLQNSNLSFQSSVMHSFLSLMERVNCCHAIPCCACNLPSCISIATRNTSRQFVTIKLSSGNQRLLQQKTQQKKLAFASRRLRIHALMLREFVSSFVVDGFTQLSLLPWLNESSWWAIFLAKGEQGLHLRYKPCKFFGTTHKHLCLSCCLVSI